MKGFTAFAQKELLELLRSFRMLILLAVLLLFGMMSPLFAKLMPELLKNLSGSGITVTLPPVAMSDAWAQFFKNIGQMGLIVLLLLFGTSLPQEIARGTLLIPLSKGLSRGAVVLAKYAAALLCWTISYSLAALLCCVYTQVLFGRFAPPRLVPALVCLWLFGAFLLALLELFGAAVPGSFGGLLLTALAAGVLLALDAFPRLQSWNPATLATRNTALLAGAVPEIGSAAWVTAAGICACLCLCVFLFRKRTL